MKQDEDTMSPHDECNTGASKKRNRSSDHTAPIAEGVAPSLLSQPQVAVFLNNRAEFNKPVTNEELRKHLQMTLNITGHIPKASLKSTLKYAIVAYTK